jgi:hypothetical protein
MHQQDEILIDTLVSRQEQIPSEPGSATIFLMHTLRIINGRAAGNLARPAPFARVMRVYLSLLACQSGRL